MKWITRSKLWKGFVIIINVWDVELLRDPTATAVETFQKPFKKQVSLVRAYYTTKQALYSTRR